jgi:hypothetical protein
MTTVLLTDRTDPQCLICERGRRRTRLSTRLHAFRLDRALAAGASPDSSARLSLRAQALIGAKARVELAGSIRGLIKRAQRPSTRFAPGVPVCRRKVLASTATLEELAERLASGEPVDARGIAQVRLLLSDGAGPVYQRPTANDLEPALSAARDAMSVAAADLA